MPQIFLTALRASPQKAEDRAVPFVASLNSANVISTPTSLDSGVEHLIIKVRADRYTRTYKVAERMGEYLLQTDFNNAASSQLNNGTKQSLAACGSTAQGASATPVTGYFNSVTAATASTMIMVKLPNASAAGRLSRPVVILNSASTDILVIPAASESLDSGTAGSTSVKVGQFKHFYCSTTAKWVTCKGPYY